jgi:membrane protease YdiL (CAAX protease family)
MEEPVTTVAAATVDEPIDQVPWTKWDMFWATLLGAAAVVALLVLMFVAAWLLEYAGVVASYSDLTGALVLVAELGLLLPVWILGVRKYGLSWSSVGFRRFDGARALGVGCLAVLATFTFNAIWAVFLGLFSLRAQPDMLPAFGGGIEGLSQALLVGGLVAPIAEEAFFRGYLFAGLRQHFGRLAAYLLSAGLFALAHILPTSYPPIFVLGLLFALLYEQTGSIWPAVIMHGSINALAFVASYLLTLLLG